MPRTSRRTTTKLLRLHPEELARITARAQACGQTPARFIRETALGTKPKAQHQAGTEPLLRGLARIGSSLEQIARLVDSDGRPALARYVRLALSDHRALVAQVVQEGRRRRR